MFRRRRGTLRWAVREIRHLWISCTTKKEIRHDQRFAAGNERTYEADESQSIDASSNEIVDIAVGELRQAGGSDI